MNLLRSLAAACCVAAFLSLPDPATAATINYDLIDAGTSYTGVGIVQYNLLDSGTGAWLLPGYILNVGDILTGTVTLNSPITVTGGFNLNLQELDDKLIFNSSFSYFNGATPVAEPSDFDHWSSETGAVGGGGIFPFGSLTGFAFDRFTFSTVILQILDQSDQPLSSTDLTPGYASISVYDVDVATTPLPGAALLMLTGLGGLAGFARLGGRKSPRAVA